MSEAFSLKHVKKAYRNFTLDVKDLTMERGYVLGLLGRNGAGKSTTIKILMNLVYPDQGDVQVLGFRQPEHEIEIKRHVGYVSEEPAFYDEMTVWRVSSVGTTPAGTQLFIRNICENSSSTQGRRSKNYPAV